MAAKTKQKPGRKSSGKTRIMYMIHPEVHKAMAELARRLAVPGSTLVESWMIGALKRYGIEVQDFSLISEVVRSDEAFQHIQEHEAARDGSRAARAR